MLKFDVTTESPILISDVFFTSNISQIVLLLQRKIPSDSDGITLTLSLKFPSLISCTTEVFAEEAIIFPTTPLDDKTGLFFLTPLSNPVSIRIVFKLEVFPLEITSDPTNLYFSLS